MLLIQIAHRAEALPLIETLRLKRNFNWKAHELFESNDVALVLSGLGKVRAAIAVAAILSSKISDHFEARERLVALNFGVAGSHPANAIGSVVMINKITDLSNARSFYPDMILRHPFPESALETHDRPCTTVPSEPILVDMEASGFYQAAHSFLPTTSISCLKVVSDHCEDLDYDKGLVRALIEPNLQTICDFIESLRAFSSETVPSLSSSDRDLVTKLSKTLKLTQFQRQTLLQLARSYSVRDREGLDVLKPYLNVDVVAKDGAKRVYREITKLLSAT